MTFTFVSNYINHHQIPLCDALYRELGRSFTFIQTMPMEEERVAMGWALDVHKLPYVQCLYEDEYGCLRKIASPGKYVSDDSSSVPHHGLPAHAFWHCPKISPQ